MLIPRWMTAQVRPCLYRRISTLHLDCCKQSIRLDVASGKPVGQSLDLRSRRWICSRGSRSCRAASCMDWCGSVDLFANEDVSMGADFCWRCVHGAAPRPGGYHGFDLLVPQAPLSVAFTEGWNAALSPLSLRRHDARFSAKKWSSCRLSASRTTI